MKPHPILNPNPENTESRKVVDAWINAIKKQARENLNDDIQYSRIAWQHRFLIPRHRDFDDYTQEEMFLEAWEMFYFENPGHLEMKGVFKKKDVTTGNTFYETGDPLIDSLERSFASGEIPDLDAAFADISVGDDIFRSKVFENENGEKLAAQSGIEGTIETPSGDKITVSGAKVQHDDFTSDDWTKKALEEDPMLKELSKLLEGKNAQH